MDFSLLEEIKKTNPNNLMAKYFSKDYYLSLSFTDQKRFEKIIASGVQNPNSQMGAYAMNANDYKDFTPFFDQLIRNYHGIKENIKIEQIHDWDFSDISCDLAAIDEELKTVSMRVRVARNISDFPLPGAMSKQQRLDFETLAIKAFVKLGTYKGFSGKYLSITPNSPFEISAKEYLRRVEKHQMFKDMSNDAYLNSAGISNDWSHGRGMYITRSEDFIVWVGEEDHLRIMCMQKGGDLGAMFEKLHKGLEILGNILPEFANSKTYGNLTSCPSNLGAGMRASLHMFLPNITNNGTNLTQLKDEAKKLGLAVRGAGGEHSDAGSDGLVDISPNARLGVSEKEIMLRLYNGVKDLWKIEKSL